LYYLDFQAGWVVLKSSGGERAWFLAEGSEPRNKLRFLAGEDQRAEEPACLMKVRSIRMNVHTYFMNNQDQELFDRTSLKV